MKNQQKMTRSLLVVSIVVFLIFVGGWTAFAANFPQTGWDFPQFYIAGSLPIDEIYDRAEYEAFANEHLAPLGVEYFPPYVRPAVFATPLEALALLPYEVAVLAFFTLQFLCFCTTLYLLLRRFGLTADLLPIFALFYPAMFGIITGQDAHGLTLLAVAGFLLLERGRDVAGGVVWGLCFYKFNLILWLPVLLLVKARKAALGSMAATGALLALASVALAPAGEYIALLQTIESYTIGFSAAKMIGLRGIAATAGLEAAYPVLAVLLLALGVVVMKRLPLDRAFALALTGSLLCSYHVNWYDGVLLLPAITLLLAQGSLPAKILSIGLLAAFPLWPKTHWIAAAIVALWALQAIPAFWRLPDGAPASEVKAAESLP